MANELDSNIQAQVVHWLAKLLGEQPPALRILFDRCVSLAECIALIEERGQTHRCCPQCDGTSLYRHGRLRGLQRYRCRSCGQSFNALTGTPLAFIRLREKWLPFLQCMLGSMTVRATAAAIGIHRNTSFRWRHRFAVMAKDDRPRPLEAIVEADETYLLESQKGSRQLTRPARRRGGKARKRGISDELDCILVARSRAGRTCDFVPGRGPVTVEQLHRHLRPVLAAGIILTTDSAQAYATFAADLKIRHEPVNLRQGFRARGAFHVQNVNAYHSRFKAWLRRFRGVASRYLLNYLGWMHALDGEAIGTPQRLLRAALMPRGNDAGNNIISAQ